MININVVLRKEVDTLPILYDFGFYYVLWRTYDVTYGDLFTAYPN
jgi:hypothetical protein